jgi:hypothetical protein
MRHLRIGTRWRGFLVALVIAGGTASAQSYGAVSAGLPVVFVSGHLGFEDLIAPAVDLRVNFGGAAVVGGGGGAFGAALSADVLWRIVSEEAQRWTPYAGAGAGLFAVGAGGGGSVGVGFGALGTGIAGVEFDLGGPAIFTELRGELLWAFGEGAIGLPGIRVGVKFPW